MDAIDRKLIEDAACAAGWTIDHWGEDNKGVPVAYRINERGGHSAFQPLYENGCCDCMGDALRLAAKLRINIEHMRTMDGKDFGINCWPVGRGDCGASEDGDLTDYTAATRRAIVRAAASIGQSQESGK